MTLSQLQHPLLKIFVGGGHDFHMSIRQAMELDQRPFRSLLIRQWVVYSSRHRGFHLTREGWEAWERFQNTSILRKDPTKPLTAYFDATAYGLRVVAKRGAA